MTSLSITWHTVGDARVCPICQALEGYTWTFEAGKDALPNTLTHPEFGVVWDVASGSKAHGHQRFNCRCSLIPQFDFRELLAKVEKLYAVVSYEVSAEYMREAGEAE